MIPMGPMMTKVWTRIERAVIREIDRDEDPDLGHRDDTESHTCGASVHMMDLQPTLWEMDYEDESNPGLKDILGI